MPLEFRRKSKVVGTVDSGVTDPDELKRIAFEALRNGVYPADSTPYINGQPVDMTVYHLERRIAEESKRREAEIAALERRLSDQLTTVIAEKIGEVMKEIDGVKTFTRETFAAIGTDIGQLREEFRATVERLVETPTLLREGLRELLRVAGGQKDDKKEKDHGN